MPISFQLPGTLQDFHFYLKKSVHLNTFLGIQKKIEGGHCICLYISVMEEWGGKSFASIEKRDNRKCVGTLL